MVAAAGANRSLPCPVGAGTQKKPTNVFKNLLFLETCWLFGLWYLLWDAFETFYFNADAAVIQLNLQLDCPTHPSLLPLYGYVA